MPVVELRSIGYKFWIRLAFAMFARGELVGTELPLTVDKEEHQWFALTIREPLGAEGNWKSYVVETQ